MRVSVGGGRNSGNGVLGNMRGIKLGKNLNLLLDILYLIFCTFEVDNLDGYCFPRLLIEAEGRWL